MKDYQLAQINIARAREALDSELMKGFVERIDEIGGKIIGICMAAVNGAG